MRKKISCLNQSADKLYQSRTTRFVSQHILCGASYRVLFNTFYRDNHFTLTPIIRLILLTLVVTTFGGLLSGCQHCSIFGVCQPPFSTEEIVAFMGKDGAVYFDIPARKNYQRTRIIDIIVHRVGEGKSPILYWSMSKRGYTYEGELASQAQDLPLPLRYGQEMPETTIRIQPKTIENGEYWIDGSVSLYDEKRGKLFGLSGRFRYENGAVRDYSTE
jgi:hypothetical protein